MINLSASRRPGARQQRSPALVLSAVLAVGIWLGVAIVHAYDTRLEEALGALQKAAALVGASSAGDVSARTQHKFDISRSKALASIQDAMDHIVAAGLTADADGGSQ